MNASPRQPPEGSSQPDQPDHPDRAHETEQPSQATVPDGTAGPEEPDPDAAPNGRRILLAALRPRLNRGQLVAAILLGLLGFALAVQLHSTADQGLNSLSQQDLVRVLGDVSQRTQRLQQEVSTLESTKRDLTSGTGGTSAAIEEARARAATLAILAGTAPAVGPGVEITILDPQGQVRAARLLDLVEELRDADAEAIQIGSVRVVASTYFIDAAGGINVDGTVLQPPYKVLAIGDPRSLSTSLEIPGGILEVLRQNDQADAVVTSSENIKITALHAISPPQYARPAPTASPSSGG